MVIYEHILTICKQKHTFHLKIITNVQEKIFKIVSKIGSFTFKLLVLMKIKILCRKICFFKKFFIGKFGHRTVFSLLFPISFFLKIIYFSLIFSILFFLKITYFLLYIPISFFLKITTDISKILSVFT